MMQLFATTNWPDVSDDAMTLKSFTGLSSSKQSYLSSHTSLHLNQNIRMRSPFASSAFIRSFKTFQTSSKLFDNQQFRAQNIVKQRNMSTAQQDLGIENTNIRTASGVSLDDQQKTLVGVVLDLFAGRPSLKKLQTWDDEGTFEDPITKAVGRKQFEPQWYGLATAFSEIERLHHEVMDGGNPIGLDLKTRYVVKGIGKEQTIDSKVLIYFDKLTGKITKVEDKWDGKLPDSSFQNAFRKINAVTVPHLVGVPKNDEEDAKKGL